MCFSAEASFTASVVLATIGYATTRIASTKTQLLLAVIPCFFAIQQFLEGITWLYLRGDIQASALTEIARISYLIFAFAIWPIWIPLAIFSNETVPYKKGILTLFLIAGAITSYKVLQAAPPLEIVPKIVANSIQYDINSLLYNKILYVAVVFIPTIISSMRYMWVYGLLSIITSAISEYLYTHNFTSVWCFAAAIVSVALYLIIRVNQKVPEKERKTSA